MSKNFCIFGANTTKFITVWTKMTMAHAQQWKSLDTSANESQRFLKFSDKSLNFKNRFRKIYRQIYSSALQIFAMKLISMQMVIFLQEVEKWDFLSFATIWVPCHFRDFWRISTVAFSWSRKRGHYSGFCIYFDLNDQHSKSFASCPSLNFFCSREANNFWIK